MALIKTARTYYPQPFATSCTTAWQRRGPNVMVLVESVAFPEGGGQLPDVGLVRQGDRTAHFTDTQKVFTTKVFPKNFPPVQVGGEIHLTLDSELGPEWDDTQPIEVVIDHVRRAQLTRSHTAAHLVYIGLLEAVPGAKEGVCGCYIDIDGGRFDIKLDDHFTPEQVEVVARVASEWCGRDHPIEIEALPEEPDCRIWVSNGVRIPCGGCHLPRTGLVGQLKLQRRSKGKSMDRLYYTLLDPLPEEFLNLYEVAPVVVGQT
jgi:alanyl-tRNA synthetase